MKKKIIIFGATGKVGIYVVRYAKEFFKNTEFEIIASGRRETKIFDEINIPYCSVDISKKEEFNKLPNENIYAVISLAAQLPTKSDGQDPRKQFEINVVGSFNILEYCRKTKADRFLFCQTIFDLSGYFDDNVALSPDMVPKFSYSDFHSFYVICKNATIEMMEHYYQKYGLKKFVFRLPTIYSYNAYPYMYNDKGEMIMRPLYVMINKALRGEPISIWGDPNYAKDMVHVYDFAQMLCKAVLVERDKGFYNVGTGMPVTLEEQVRAIVDVFSPKDAPSPILYEPNKTNGGGTLINVDDAVEQLGYKPVYDVKMIFEDYKKEMKLNKFYDIRKAVL